MQDIHGMGGGGWLPGGGDRRLRPHNHQALKCPRCDSLSTKFCYYNNYNLSQPRHFCKSCRRYWTRGGVLRNVPVGGGCRKTKRPKHKISSCNAPRRPNPYDRTSSGESSSLTAAATASVVTPATTTVESLGPMPIPAAGVHDLPDSRFLCSNTSNLYLLQQTDTEGQICTKEIGSLTSRLASTAGDLMGFNTADVGAAPYGQGNQTPVEENSEMNIQMSIDWRFDQGLFDLTAAIDPASYWNQNQWLDVNDQSPNNNYIP